MYYAALESAKFVGHPSSFFSCLLTAERRSRSRWAALVGVGDNAIAMLFPGILQMPWVFTFTSDSSSYEFMMKAAVRSAIHFELKPYCIYLGNSSTALTFLLHHNVTIIHHTPEWIPRFVSMLNHSNTSHVNIQHSHLYASVAMLTSTFIRIDIPVLDLLSQYTYVLYTDVDVYFRRRITFADFGMHPNSVAMAYETENHFPHNAGVMLMNLPVMRWHYKVCNTTRECTCMCTSLISTN